MSLRTFVGSLTTPATNGSVSYDPVGRDNRDLDFMPQLILFFSTGQSGTGFSNPLRLTQGAADAHGNQGCISALATDNVSGATAASTARKFTTTTAGATDGNGAALTVIRQSGPTTWCEARFTSFDDNGNGTYGFTLNWTTTTASPASVCDVDYMLIGGVTDARLTHFGFNTTDGGAEPYTKTVSTTCKADCFMLFHNRTGTAGGNAQLKHGFGAAVGTAAADQFYIWLHDFNAVNTTDTGRTIQKIDTGHVAFGTATGNSTTADFSAKLTAVRATEVDLQIDDEYSSNQLAFCIAIEGGTWTLEDVTQATTVNREVVTGVGHLSRGAIAFGCNAAANTALDSNKMKLAVGLSDHWTRRALWWGDHDGEDPTIAKVSRTTTNWLRFAHYTTNPGRASVTDGEADLLEFTADGLRHDWTKTDGTARRYFILTATDTTPPERVLEAGVNPELTWGIDDIDSEIEDIIALRVPWVRLTMEWSNVETSKGVYDAAQLATHDYAIQAMENNGINVILCVLNCPSWANGGNAEKVGPSDPQDFADFMAYAVDRWPLVDLWEIWNEPNYTGFWDNAASNWPNFAPGGGSLAYAELLDSVYPAIKAVDASAQVGFGGIVGGNYTWVQDVYYNLSTEGFDVMCIHPYTSAGNTVPEDMTLTGSPARISRDRFPSFTEVRRVMVAEGDSAKPIFFTEFGNSTTTFISP